MKTVRMLSLMIIFMCFQFSAAQTPLHPAYSPASPQAESLSDGLVVHLPLNGTLTDLSGNGNNGTAVGGLTFTADKYGSPNGAAAFNGIDSWITIPDAPSLHPTDQLSVCFWIRIDAIVANYSPVFSKAGPVLPNWSDREYFCELKHNIGAAGYFEMYSAGDGSGQSRVASKTYSVDRWLHFAGIIDLASHQMSIYIDGGLDATAVNPYSTFNRSSDPLLIGWTTEEKGDSAPLKGAIADFRIYSRALSEIEIHALAGKVVDLFPSTVHFPLLKVGTQDSASVSISNLQESDTLMLGPMSSTNSAFSVQPSTLVVPPLESRSLTIVYSPSAAGRDTGSILIPTNHPQVSQLWMPVSGRGYVLTEAPLIASIEPAPYGSNTARITWIRSISDEEGAADPVTAYSIWRRIDGPPAYAPSHEVPWPAADILSNDPAWMFVQESPAIGVERYAADVSFSSAYSPPGPVSYAVFMVVAKTRDLHVFQSEPDSLVFFGTTGIGNAPEAETAQHFNLEQNYPNPFNPTTVIRYEVPATDDVQIVVCDILGRQVAVLVNGRESAGIHEVGFDGTGLASGVYVCTLRAGDYFQTRKMLLMR